MVRHSVIVCRDDSSTASQPISFAGEAWLRYVPIRMSETITVQERLPQGAASVLINQNHTYTDLFLPIDATEKRLLDAIDGNRTIAEISRVSPSSQGQPQLELVRSLFERLWWHDQVVFDASAVQRETDDHNREAHLSTR
jgi:hypothetical protein